MPYRWGTLVEIANWKYLFCHRPWNCVLIFVIRTLKVTFEKYYELLLKAILNNIQPQNFNLWSYVSRILKKTLETFGHRERERSSSEKEEKEEIKTRAPCVISILDIPLVIRANNYLSKTIPLIMQRIFPFSNIAKDNFRNGIFQLIGFCHLISR